MRRTTTLLAALACAAGSTAPAEAAEERFVVPVSVPAAGGSTDAPDVQYAGASRDGRVVAFTTAEALIAADQDEDTDIYVRRGGHLELASVPAEGAAGAGSVRFWAISEDGSTIVFEAEDAFTPDDESGGTDVFARRDGQTELVTRSSRTDFVIPSSPLFLQVSSDGSHIVFDTQASYTADDTDFFGSDVYDSSGGQLRLASPSSGGGFGDEVGLRDISADGTRIFMETSARLDQAADTDGENDVYQRVGGQTVLMTPGTAEHIGFADISRDGTRAYFHSREPLLPADTDGGAQDVYGRAETGPYLLVSTGPLAPNEPVDASFQRVDDTGAHVAFTTFERLTADDLDNGDATSPAEDIYLRVDETRTELASTAAGEDASRFDAPYVVSDLSRTGGRLFWYGNQVLADDQEPFQDAFVRENGVTTRVSVGEINDQAYYDASFAGASDDGSRVVFQVDGPFTTEDGDESDDLYVRSEGHTVLVTPDAPEPCTLPSYQCVPTYAGISSDGTRVRFLSYDRLDPADDDLSADIYESRIQSPADLGSELGTLQVDEQAAGAPVFTDLTIAEPYDDVFGATVKVTAGGGAGDHLAFTDTADIKGTVSPDGRTLELTGRATDAQYQAALRTVTYRNTDDDPAAAPRTIAVVVDNGADSETETRQVAVTPVNDAPALTAGGTVAYAENGAARRVAPALGVADPDDTRAEGATVRISAGFAAGQDVLELPMQPGIASAYDPATGVLALTGDATVADYQAALREVRYRNASDAPSDTLRIIEYSVTDGAAAATAVTSQVEVLAVDDPPVVILTGAPVSVAADAGPVLLDAAATVADADSAALARVIVRVSSGLTAGDQLAGGSAGPVTATPGPEGRLTLTGAATPAEYAAALRTVTFDAATSGTRVLEILAEDATSVGDADSRAVVVTGGPAAEPTPSPSPTSTPTPTPTAEPTIEPTPRPVKARVAYTRIRTPREYEAIRGRVRVGCEVVGRPLDRCRVTLMRQGRVLGSGRAQGDAADVLEVTVRLNRVARRLLRRPGALRVSLDARARSADRTPTVARTFRGVVS